MIISILIIQWTQFYFNSRKLVEGKVTRVSRDIKVASQSGQGFYEVEVEVRNVGNGINLSAGQVCEMSIVVKQERLIKWVLEKMELKL